MDAGLPDGEKKLIEAAFRNKTLRVICATSTLATGVNLPADRVVMRGPWPDWKHAGGMKIDKYVRAACAVSFASRQLFLYIALVAATDRDPHCACM